MPSGIYVEAWRGIALQNGLGGQDLFIGFVEPVIIRGSQFNDFIAGTIGDDSLFGNGGQDRLYGGAGNDTLAGGTGNDIMFGGADTDTVSYSGAANGVTVELWRGIATGDGIDQIFEVENILGSAFSDFLAGTADANLIQGAGGDDRLYGGGGDDVLDGGTGNDLMFGGTGNNMLVGGAGFDTVDYAESGVGVTIELWRGSSANGQGGVDTYSSIEGVYGTQFNDLLAGTESNDILWGRGGSDSIYGGDGDDWIAADTGTNFIDGGLGFDWLSYHNSGIGVAASLFLQSGTGAGINDTIRGVENLWGSSQIDTLVGDDRPNTLNGWLGNDILQGGAHADTLLGGEGFDRFVYAALIESNNATQDRIMDFVRGADIVDVAAIDANPFVGGDQAFLFVGNAGFTGVGQIRYAYDAAIETTFIQGNTDGDFTSSELVIQLHGNIALAGTDFSL